MQHAGSEKTLSRRGVDGIPDVLLCLGYASLTVRIQSETRRIRAPTFVTDTPLVQLSIKVDAATRDRLEEAAKTAGTSLSDFARRVLREAVSETSEIRALTQRASGVEYEVMQMRRDLASAVEAILVTVASSEKVTPEQAKAFVDEVLRKNLSTEF